MGVFREKNILQNDFEGKKACKEIPGKNDIQHWKKISLLIAYNVEKEIPEVWEKYTSQTKSLIPRPKSQMANP